MYHPFLQPARDLEPLGPRDGKGGGLWRSTGEDPGLLIRLPAVRPRYLLVKLHCKDQATLSPQVYFNFGGGFSERNSLYAGGGGDVCLIVDIGRFGLMRAIRLDPSSGPGLFSCEVEAFATKDRAKAAADAWAKAFPAGRSERIDGIGLGWMIRQRLTWSLRASTLNAHLEHVHALAGRLARPDAPSPSGEPWLSIVVPTYDTPEAYLDDLLDSFRGQETEGVELIFSDDASSSKATLEWLRAVQASQGARVVFNASNGGIAAATNAGLSTARGTWVALLDHDDLIAPHALKSVRRALLEHPQAQFLYTDEVVVDRRLKPRGLVAKPAYDPVLLSGVNYINHFSFYRRSRLAELGGLRDGFQGSQDYELLLRYLDGLDEAQVLHLPYPAYWWRRDGQTFSARHLDTATQAARKALSGHFLPRHAAAKVTGAITPSLHRVRFSLTTPAPKVSVVIPSRNAFELISTVMRGLLEKTDYPELEILVIDNGTTDARVLELYDGLTRAHENVHVHRREEGFNFARAVNRGMSLASGEHFLLLNNDISILHSDWLREMVSCLNYENAGIVGAKLLYPDGKIQHAGVIAGFGGLAGHWYLGKPADFGGPMNRLHVRASMTCVTAAAMLVSGKCRAAVGDMDEKNFAVAYNDVDYCLRAHAKGFRTVWTPFATLIHHESATRGSEKKLENRVRFEREKQNLRRIHATGDFIDPAASPLYGRDRSTPVLIRPAELPAARQWHEAAPFHAGDRSDAAE